ncbi:hypothetical protein SESBI_35100, partial [Sesbania bispinosa]
VDTTTNSAQSKSGMEKANDTDQYNDFDDFKPRIGSSAPIPIPELTRRQLYYQSARYLSKSHTPTEDSILAQRSTSTHTSNPIEEPLLSSSVLTQSAPVIKIKNTLCLVSALTFVGAFNLLKSPDTIIHSMVSKPRQQYVIYVGRKLFQ